MCIYISSLFWLFDWKHPEEWKVLVKATDLDKLIYTYLFFYTCVMCECVYLPAGGGGWRGSKSNVRYPAFTDLQTVVYCLSLVSHWCFRLVCAVDSLLLPVPFRRSISGYFIILWIYFIFSILEPVVLRRPVCARPTCKSSGLL